VCIVCRSSVHSRVSVCVRVGEGRLSVFEGTFRYYKIYLSSPDSKKRKHDMEFIFCFVLHTHVVTDENMT
jgi:hypothetical protein